MIGYIGSLYGYEGVDLLDRGNGPDARSPAGAFHRGRWSGRGALKARIRDLGLQDRALAVGAVPHADIARFYSVVDLLVYPRRRTRLTELVTPLKPLEAMAQGKLVLASDIEDTAS